MNIKTSAYRSCLFVLFINLLGSNSVFGQRRLDMSLEGQLSSAIKELEEKMEVDKKIKGKKLRLGRFTPLNLHDSNYQLEFERTIRLKMSKHLTEQSDLVLSGTYQMLPGTQVENKDLVVIQIRIEISEKFRTLQSAVREINRSTDINRITGATAMLPDDFSITREENLRNRNKAADQAIKQPNFRLMQGVKITTKNRCNYAVAIKVRAGGTGKSEFVTPRKVNGFAFVDLDVTDTFSIVVYNFDTKNDAVANVSIDGLNVANTFCVDEEKLEGYLVPRASDAASPKDVIIPGWMKTTRSRQENVFEFVVNKLGQGAATEMKSSDRIGVIQVDFFEAVPEGEEDKLRKRGFGEVGRGRPLDVNYKVVRMVQRDSPTAQISVRYSNRRE